MSSWKMVMLGEVGKLQGGYAFKSTDFIKNEIPIIRIGNLNGNTVDLDYDICYPKNFLSNNSIYEVKKNDILIAMSGATVGKIGKYDIEEPALLNQRVGKITLNKNLVDFNYIYRYVKSEIFNSAILNLSSGCAQPNISNKQIETIKIPLPPLEVQKEIADILDKASELIEKRKMQIAKLDELTKSIFKDMFGENYEYDKLENLCEYITKGTTPSAIDIFDEPIENSIPFLKVYNITKSGKVNFAYKPSYVTRHIHETNLKRSIVYPDDVLMNIVGPPLGKIGLVPQTYKECNVNQAMAIFRCKSKLNPRYLLHCLYSRKIFNSILELAVGIRQQNLSLQQCRDIKIPVPPIDLQNEFANIVEKIEEQKALLNQGLEKLELNYKSLMQKLFN